MRATVRFWTLSALPVVLIGWAVVLDRALPLFAAVGVCAWLLTQQYRFARGFARTVNELSVSQRLSTNATVAGTETYFSLSASMERSPSVHVSVDPSPPATADMDVESVHLAPDDQTNEIATVVSWPVAGIFQFDPAAVTVRDALGLFEQRFTSGPGPTVTVEAPETGGIHVGEGGTPVTVGFGDHGGRQTGEGNQSQQVRAYVPGDRLRQIDWKATARLGETHVREFTAQFERQTVLFLDHRAGMAAGSPGKTKLAIARELALAITENARRAADPLGCYTVGNDGITRMFDPLTRAKHYERVRRHVGRVETTTERPSNDDFGASNPATTQGPAPRARPDQTRANGRRLVKGETTMERRLASFFDGPGAVVKAIPEDPLFSAVKSVSTRLSGATWTVILTDDASRAELREAVESARHSGGPVLVFLFPSALYRGEGLTDIDRMYADYTAFEQFRTELATFNGVSAFEVGPADRIQTVLARGRKKTRPTET